VWHIHEYGDRGLGFSFILGRFFSLKLVDRLSDTVIVNAKGVEAHFAGPIAPNKLRLLYYPLEAPPAPAAKAAAPNFRLVIMGSLSHKKRQEDAIRAMAILARRGVEARLAVVGPGSPEILHYLGGLAEELGVAGAVDFVGETDSPFDFFAAADIALICSLDEAFGRVTVEAMKMGTPVIGADSGGTSELISDGFNGLLFEPLNVEDLADKIERLVQDRDLLRRMGDNARRRARETFNSDKFEARLLGLLSEALGKESRAAGGASPPAAGR
jgi:glycosyltransferase involved in cell wall biosynthesis